MSEQTFHTTRQDLRKAESRVAAQHGGNNPSDSYLSQMKVSHSHLTQAQKNIANHEFYSPSLTRTPTSPSKSTRPRPTCLYPTSRPLPVTGTLPTSELSTSALVVSRAPSLVTTTPPFEAPPLQEAAPASTVKSCTRAPHLVAMLAVSALRAWMTCPLMLPLVTVKIEFFGLRDPMFV